MEEVNNQGKTTAKQTPSASNTKAVAKSSDQLAAKKKTQKVKKTVKKPSAKTGVKQAQKALDEGLASKDQNK